MSSHWEEQLFDAIREGDESAFERIYDLYYARVRLVAWRISHRGDWVDEILNESWCRAFTQRREYLRETPFLAWMAGIVRNVYREECRRSPLVLANEGESSSLRERVEEVTPEAVAEEAELLAGLHDCVSRLKAEDAELVRLRFFEGLPLREVAQRMGVPESTLRDGHIPAAYKALRKCLESKGLRFSQVFSAQDRPESQ
jgi:RNA polymerase sigma factor (sigma-70 family)